MLWTMAATWGVDFANTTLQLLTLRACKILLIQLINVKQKLFIYIIIYHMYWMFLFKQLLFVFVMFLHVFTVAIKTI